MDAPRGFLLGGVPLLCKRLAAYSGGLICQKILELEKAQKERSGYYREAIWVENVQIV